jgi:hypothetical protein
MVIAALLNLSSAKFNSSRNAAQLTTDILAQFGRLDIKDFYHDKIPIFLYDSWSWCPFSLFDLDGLASLTDSGRYHRLVNGWPC